MTFRRGVAVLAVAACATLPASTVAASAPRDGLRSLREFRDYRVFTLGARYKHHPLVDVSRRGGSGAPRFFSLIYGDCSPDSRSGLCAPPYEVQNYDGCKRNPTVYAHAARARTTARLRGARIDFFYDDRSFDRAEVYSGRTTVVIFTRTAKRARNAARALRSADRSVLRSDPLPPPRRALLHGRLSCASHR